MKILRTSTIPLLIVGLLVTAAAAQRPLRRESTSVRIEGYVGTKPAKATLQVTWTVMLKGEKHQFYVTKLQVLRGNLAYFDIINELQPYEIALTIDGEDLELDRFATAPPGQKISAVGYLRFAGPAHYFFISSVDYPGAPKPGGEGSP